MKDITLLISHPDDEALFLWPFLSRVKRIVCVSNDIDNREREWCRKRGECLDEVATLLGCAQTQFAYNSEFYREPTRNGQLKHLAELVIQELTGSPIIATHNAWGEYGNLDHILCHNIAQIARARQKGGTILTTDTAEEINWFPVTPWRQGEVVPSKASFEDGYEEVHHIDMDLFNRIKAIYDARGCWTWAWEPQKECRVFAI